MYKSLFKDRVEAVGCLWVSSGWLCVKRFCEVLGWVKVEVCAQCIRYLYDRFSSAFLGLNNLLFFKSSTLSTILTKETTNLNKLLLSLGA
jgi:hypothetical protein